jgi:hypothetical protein
LTKAAHKLAEEIYKQAASKQQAGAKPQEEPAGPREEGPSQEGASPGGKKEEDIIDAEYKEEDDKK